MRIAVGTATTTAIPNDGSQAESRFGVNPSRNVVITRDMVKDIATAMIAGTMKGAYLGSTRG
jgi:hypothetical protein